MSILDKFSQKISDTAKATAKKSGDIVELTKANLALSSEEEKLNKKYLLIGELVYNIYAKGQKVPEEAEQACASADESKKTIDELKSKILQLKKLKKCAACGFESDTEALFCPKCGNKL